MAGASAASSSETADEKAFDDESSRCKSLLLERWNEAGISCGLRFKTSVP